MIKDNKKKQLFENYSHKYNLENYPDWVKNQSEEDPNFFRWLFDEDFENDYDMSLDDEQKEEFKEFLDDLIANFDKEIKTLYDLAEFINLSGDYPASKVEEICANNGWRVLDDGDIALDLKSNLIAVIDDAGDAIVRGYKGGFREGAGRPSLYTDKKRVQLLLTEDNVEKLTNYAEECGFSKSDCINYILDTYFAQKI